MRSSNLSQPCGGPFLQEMLDYTTYSLQDTSYRGTLYYRMCMGCVGEAPEAGSVNRTQLHRPAYNLVIYHNDNPILVVHYELNQMFSLEISEEEAERVEDYLANEVIGLLAVRGIGFFLAARLNSGILFSMIRTESDDKKFMSLN